MDIGGIEVVATGSRLLTADDVAEVTKHIEQLENQRYEMWVRMTHMELHECPGCANVADLQEALEENAKLRELVNGLTWCCENYGCGSGCPLYDKSEPDHCREPWLKRELGIEVSDG